MDASVLTSSTAAPVQFSWCRTTAYRDKSLVVARDQGTWANTTTDILGLLDHIGSGGAFCCRLALNATHRPEYQGPADPTQGPYRVDFKSRSERVNANAAPDRLWVHDIDGDGELAQVLADPWVQQQVMGIYTTPSHRQKPPELGFSNERFRLIAVAAEPLPREPDTTVYRDRDWRWRAIWDALAKRYAQVFGRDRLRDLAGQDKARLFYGCDLSAHPCPEQHLINRVLDPGWVEQVLTEAEPQWRQPQGGGPQGNRFSGNRDEGVTLLDLRRAEWILTNGVLDPERAECSNEWWKVGQAAYNLDPEGLVLKQPFLRFCQQARPNVVGADYIDDASSIDDTWETQFRRSESTGIGYLIKIADEDDPEWRDRCPYLNPYSTASQAMKPYFEPPISRHLDKLTMEWLEAQPPVKPRKFRKSVRRASGPATSAYASGGNDYAP